ncbi:hypothetical protein AVEN_62588-1 [Araneus ventricosus]|uniref:Uncharacterized protein n=1 Tax=Araneus ventricosus TaxID=182803 RepID=A0A4Y2L2S4_ARAVE|nr:hypothetical protein AVEN_62588-1 [Araneus ventricosus]
MCPVKRVTPHSGSVAGRTDFLTNRKKSTCKKGWLKEGPPPSGQALTGLNGPTSLTFVGKFVTVSEPRRKSSKFTTRKVILCRQQKHSVKNFLRNARRSACKMSQRKV